MASASNPLGTGIQHTNDISLQSMVCGVSGWKKWMKPYSFALSTIFIGMRKQAREECINKLDTGQSLWINSHRLPQTLTSSQSLKLFGRKWLKAPGKER